MFLGIDPTCSETKASACAVLDGDGALAHLTVCRTVADILDLAEMWHPITVAIDSPLAFPGGMCCLEESCPCRSVHDFKGRACEQELFRRGIPLYVTTKRSFIKPMIYRSIGLARELEARGYRVVEVYPYAAKVALFGRPIPPKTKREGLAFLRERLGELVSGFASHPGRVGHDLCDAVVGAHTAYLHGLGRTEAVGPPEEVSIVVPRPAA